MSLLHNQQSTAAIRPIDPLSQNSFFYSIGDILARHWDPLDISDTHWPHSEYEAYIPAVYNLALNSSDSEKIFQYLSRVALDDFGLKDNLANDKRAACLIVAVKDFYFRNIYSL